MRSIARDSILRTVFVTVPFLRSSRREGAFTDDESHCQPFLSAEVLGSAAPPFIDVRRSPIPSHSKDSRKPCTATLIEP